MSRLQYIALTIIVLLMACQLRAAADRNHHLSRKLLQRNNSRFQTNTAANAARSQAMTGQAIEEAVNNGAGMGYTRRAGAVGSTMAWAVAQNDQPTFNAVERWVGSTYGVGK